MANSQTKIKNETDDNISKILVWIFGILGIKGMPDKTQSMILNGYIRNHLFNYSLAEIKLAFELAIDGRLDVGLDKVEHYQSFSPMYLSRIMQSYQRYSFNKLKDNKMIEEKQEPTEQEKNMAVINGIKDTLKRHRENQLNDLDRYIASKRYDWLAEREIIVLNTSNKAEIRSRAIEKWKKHLLNCENTEKSKGNLNGYKYIREILDDFQNRCKGSNGREVIINYCKEIAFFDWLENIVKNNLDIETILK